MSEWLPKAVAMLIKTAKENGVQHLEVDGLTLDFHAPLGSRETDVQSGTVAATMQDWMTREAEEKARSLDGFRDDTVGLIREVLTEDDSTGTVQESMEQPERDGASGSNHSAPDEVPDERADALDVAHLD